MSARTPRRTFAASFVITLSAAPACMTAPPPPHPNPPGPTEPPPTPVERDHRDEAGPVERPHRAEPTPGPIISGNPPAPAPDLGVAEDSNTSTTERRWYLEMRGGKCTTRANVSCPKAQPGHAMPTCNPPPPHAYECPNGMTDGTSMTIVQWAGAKDCVVPPPASNCPKGAMCNPPPPRKMTCPQ